ncbi:phage fiber-tail adaptor protein [Komagataeibacter medellinensis]|uniref:Uncharacterized protein n=1 Tax=Komagataeibacter medellinensis (strain NBRC 3288 / BCRC 11682 / LMG 1693 / Kondo 51) TaxID=634177 RepID=G2I781_KOMMN|nr:hypothetical protein [Komagataeibacter medellinensis]BAK83978.1 hypothetical protein GLX_15660 [Komagataeibacter medellinensis NBRC 3288]BAK84535.1 hypothetical protein GLX_21230 [Komagataeibacter medellinensis NBRC 3288]
MTASWVASRARTILFPVPGDSALRGISVRPFPRAWPPKVAGDALDYSVDYTPWLADCNDTISTIAVKDVSAAPATGLSIDWAVFVNGIVTLGLSGGQPGPRYEILITVTTAQKRTITGRFTLSVSASDDMPAASACTPPDITFTAGTITINGTANA